jgi:hypothetical protein
MLDNSFIQEITAGKFERLGAWINIADDSSATWALFAKKGRTKEKRTS